MTTLVVTKAPIIHETPGTIMGTTLATTEIPMVITAKIIILTLLRTDAKKHDRLFMNITEHTPSYESQSIQRQPPAAPASSAMSYDRRHGDRSEMTLYPTNRQVQSRPMSGQYDTGFDQPVPSMNPAWERTRERSPVRGGYVSSQGYGTRDSTFQGFGSRTPTVPPLDNRRGLPRDPYSSYGPNNMNNKPDWHAPVVGDYHYDKTGLIAARNRNGEYGILGKWYQKRKDSPWSVLFLTVGMFLLLCGLVNVLICIDYHYYCRFWAGFIVSWIYV